MKNIDTIRNHFREARNNAKAASPSTVDNTIENLNAISEHCKYLYSIGTSYIERAKCINIYESIDNVILIMKEYGYCHSAVADFFGLSKSKGTTFGDIALGKGTVKAPPHSDYAAPCDSSTRGAPIPLNITPPAPKTASPSPSPIASTASESPEKVTGSKESNCHSDNEQTLTLPTPNSVLNNNIEPINSDNKIPVPRKDPLEPQDLKNYIGQSHITTALLAEIAAARKLGRKYINNVLLFGQPGLGKSTLMKLVAEELGVEYIFIDCTTFGNDTRSERNFHQIFLNIIKMGRPVVIAMDEIHTLSNNLQSRLLTLLESRIYSYVENGISKTVEIQDFTFIAATTDYDAVMKTIKDRCKHLTFLLRNYTREELSQIFCNKLTTVGLKPENDEVIFRCVNRFRGSLRDINAIVNGLFTMAVNYETSTVTVAMAEKYFSDRGQDAIGLYEKDIQILNIIRDEERGYISEDTLAARAYLDPKILKKEYEPHLMKIGFMSISHRGRYLTPKAEDYLKYGYFDFGDGVVIGEKPTADSSAPAEAPHTLTEPSCDNTEPSSDNTDPTLTTAQTPSASHEAEEMK